jgi:DNA-binding MarR family transcriptional regulator
MYKSEETMSPQKENEDFYSLFLQEKPRKILVYLKKENKQLYIAMISKNVNATYAHTFNVLKRLENLNLVSFKESGRIKLVKLTELGEEVAKVILNLMDLLKLGKMENELTKVYESEIKGKLREQMDKEQIAKQINRLKTEIIELSKDNQLNVVVTAKKLLKRMDDILAEVFGFPPG